MVSIRKSASITAKACSEQKLGENFVCGFTLSYNIIRRGYLLGW